MHRKYLFWKPDLLREYFKTGIGLDTFWDFLEWKEVLIVQKHKEYRMVALDFVELWSCVENWREIFVWPLAYFDRIYKYQ